MRIGFPRRADKAYVDVPMSGDAIPVIDGAGEAFALLRASVATPLYRVLPNARIAPGGVVIVAAYGNHDLDCARRLNHDRAVIILGMSEHERAEQRAQKLGAFEYLDGRLERAELSRRLSNALLRNTYREQQLRGALFA